MVLFLNVGRNCPRTVVSHHFSAACSFLPWAASKSLSLLWCLAHHCAVGCFHRQTEPSTTFPHSDVFHASRRTRGQLWYNNHRLPSFGARTTGFGSRWCVLGALLVEHSVLLDVAPGWHFFETIGEIRVACLPDSTKLAQWAWLVNTL